MVNSGSEGLRSGRPLAAWPAGGLFLLALMMTLYRAPPQYDWDLIGYVAVVQSFRLHDPAAMHAATYASIREEIPPARYAALIDPGDPLRRAIAEDPDILARLVPLYSVKPLYPALMYVLGMTGLSYVDAATLISRVAFIGIAGIVVLWLRRHLNAPLALVVAALLMAFPPVHRLAQYSTPDALSVLLYLTSFYLALEKGKPAVALMVGVVTITARPDNIAYFLPFAAALYGMFRSSRAAIAALGVAGVATYLLQSKLSGNPGWGVTFYRSFIAQLPMEGLNGDPVPLSLTRYAAAALRQYTEMLATRDYVLLFVPLAAFGLWSRLRDRAFTDPCTALFAVNLVNIAVHLLAFPRELDRYLVGAYVALLIGSVATAASIKAWR